MIGELGGTMGSMLDALPGMLVVSRRRDGRILFANQRAATHFGLGRGEDGSVGAATLFVRPTSRKNGPIALDDKAAQANCVAAIVDHDGRQLLIGGRAGTFIEGDEELVVVSFLDGSGQKADNQLTRDAYQSATVRRIFALLTHQLGNALIPVMTFADLTLADNATGRVRKDYLQRIVAGAERCASLVDEMRDFCRTSPSVDSETDLTDAVRYAETVLTCALPKQVALDTDYDDVPLTVSADARLLQDIIVGLGISALDSIGNAPSLIMLSTGSAESAAGDELAELRIDILDFQSSSKIAANANGVNLVSVEMEADSLEIATAQEVVRGMRGSLEVEHTAEGLCIRLILPMEPDALVH